MPQRRRATARGWFAGALALALVPRRAVGDDDKAEPTDTTGPTELTASFRGVTADSIKIGIMIVDYSKIAFAVDFNRGDQQEIVQIFIDDINANGGILGRKIVPVYKIYNPITNVRALCRSAPRSPRTTRSSRCSACSSTSRATRSSASSRDQRDHPHRSRAAAAVDRTGSRRACC